MWTEKIILNSPALNIAHSYSDGLGVNDISYRAFISRFPGGSAFDRALHLYGAAPLSQWDDIHARNAHLMSLYGDVVAGFRFFAEDVFGNQFGFHEGGCAMFDIETAKHSPVGGSFVEWIRKIEEAPNYLTGHSLLLEWQQRNARVLDLGERLCPKTPFVMGGDYMVDNLYACDWRRNIEFRHSIFEQIKNLPDGTAVELKIGHPQQP